MNDLDRLKNVLALLQEMKLVTENEFLTPNMSAYLMEVEDKIARYLDYLENRKGRAYNLKNPKQGIRNEKSIEEMAKESSERYGELFKSLAEVERKEKGGIIMDYEKEIDRLKTINYELEQRIISEAREAAMLRKLNKELSERVNKHSRGETIDNQIYVIVYIKYENEGDGEAFANPKYFTNKDNAIHQLEKEGFEHMRDDEYSATWYLHAEIILLTKEE